MIGMSDEQVLEYFKESFPLKIEAQLLETNDTDTALAKQEFLYCCSNLSLHKLRVHLC